MWKIFSCPDDKIEWKLEKEKKFSVKSFYNILVTEVKGPHFKHIWRGKMPSKIKIRMWLLENRVILTKDNMMKRKFKGDPSCHFCSQRMK